MIVWLSIGGSLFILLTIPAKLFGWICGQVVRVMVRDRKPPLRPPI